MEAFLGTVMLFAGTYVPSGWAACDGRLLSIQQNPALFALLGTTYGGDGRTTFALPDLRGRVPVGPGQGPGLTPYALGATGGVERVTLTHNELPPHNHGLPPAPGPNSSTGAGVVTAPTSATPQTAVTQPSGGGQPHENRQPYVALNYIICMQGIFPSRD